MCYVKGWSRKEKNTFHNFLLLCFVKLVLQKRFSLKGKMSWQLTQELSYWRCSIWEKQKLIFHPSFFSLLFSHRVLTFPWLDVAKDLWGNSWFFLSSISPTLASLLPTPHYLALWCTYQPDQHCWSVGECRGPSRTTAPSPPKIFEIHQNICQ